MSQLASVAASRSERSAARRVLDAIASPGPTTAGTTVRRAVLVGLAAGLEGTDSSLAEFLMDSSVAARMFDDLLEHACAAVVSEPESHRQLELIRFLRCGSYERVQEPLGSLPGSAAPQSVQLAAVDALTSFGNVQVAKAMLKHWSRYLPAVRRKVVQELLSRSEWALPLLRSIESGTVPRSEIDSTRRVMLLQHSTATIRTLAADLFSEHTASSRVEVVARYHEALSLNGNRQRGAQVYVRECAVCHRLGTSIHPLGPNLLLSSTRDAETLLANILDPNRYVDPQYIQYVVVDRSGRVYTGMVVSETENGITLRRGENDQITIPRRNIGQLRGTGISMMPEGFEARITLQEMTDLIAFLLEAQYDRGTDPGMTEPPLKAREAR